MTDLVADLSYAHIPYDLLRHSKTFELMLCPPWMSGDVVGDAWTIVGVNVSYYTDTTPFGDIGAVIE